MSDLSADDFPEFFKAIYDDQDPYSWQTRLAAGAVSGNWPDAIDLPTGSGKTACIDVAIFALACQAHLDPADRTAPRRIFFCVNRRVIVDEAHQRAQRIAWQLWKADRDRDTTILGRVAAALRKLSGTNIQDMDAPPLDVLELRGGIFRDNRWARSVAQPTVVCTTIDQLGSRLLFRGYGVSSNAAPIQAALIAYDSLVLLDEAHISRPFHQSLESVRTYLDPARWAKQPLGPRPMIFVPMTATLPSSERSLTVIKLDEADRNNDSLKARLTASKPAELSRVADLEKAIVSRAETLAKSGPAAIGIIVNRVATAKSIYRALRSKLPDTTVELVIGSMRPVDRDKQALNLAQFVGRNRPPLSTEMTFVVATQCLECGADYDFDVLLTECASLDALRQRFGRLNRGGRDIQAGATIFAKEKEIQPDDQLDDNDPLDPIYGNALSRTWNWLHEHATTVEHAVSTDAADPQTNPPKKTSKITSVTKLNELRQIDFGIDAFSSVLDEQADGRIPQNLLAPSASANAPVMLPAYLDFWCQTSPVPSPDPDVSLFIHGPQAAEPDVLVCWRCDLDTNDSAAAHEWCDIVALLPPTSAECMRLPISRLRRWITKSKDDNDDSDLLSNLTSNQSQEKKADRNGKPAPIGTIGVLWRGAENSKLLQSPGDLRPGDTLVLPVTTGGWDELGHIPEKSPIDIANEQAGLINSQANYPRSPIDIAEAAFHAARGKWILRLNSARLDPFKTIDTFKTLIERVNHTEEPPSKAELARLMAAASADITDDSPIKLALEYFGKSASRFTKEQYPNGCGVVITSRKRVAPTGKLNDCLPSLDEGEDDASRTGRTKSVTLIDHTENVADEMQQILKLVPPNVPAQTFARAVEHHDWGKVDERFQAMLCRTDRTDAYLLASLPRAILAKSDGLPQTRAARDAARQRAGLPKGFRHEMLSVQLAQKVEWPEIDDAERELVLHLIAAHHGYARPFAPVVLDEDPPSVAWNLSELSSTERRALLPHRLDSGIAERFWALTRNFGWWGLAYLEALVRLADQQASAREDAEEPNDANIPTPEKVNS